MKKLSFVLTLAVMMLVGANAYSQNMQMGSYKFTPSTPGYTLDKGTGERVVTYEVQFKKAFDVKPEIITSVYLLDADKGDNVRYDVLVKSVSRDGFTIQVNTWNSSKIYTIGVNWLALSAK